MFPIPIHSIGPSSSWAQREPCSKTSHFRRESPADPLPVGFADGSTLNSGPLVWFRYVEAKASEECPCAMPAVDARFLALPGSDHA
jgi:hypothetical protein